jgi:carboxylate-amine ligase
MHMSSLVLERPEPALEATPTRKEEMCFHASSQPSVGVEVEVQILDRDSGDLAPGAVRILKACSEESLQGVTAELMQSMIEVKTGVCHDVSAAKNEIVSVLRRVRNIAGSLGYDLALGATHPFHRTSTSTVFPDVRYERILDRLAWLTYQRVVFGLHVHVGVPSGDMAIAAINHLVRYLPHLVALSASSPFWQGVDTGLASARTALYRMLPHAGVPRYFTNWKEFRTYCRVLRDCHTIASYKDIYWDIRPRPDLGTIEFRICDMPMTLTEVFQLVALMRTLTIATLRLLEEKPRSRRGDYRRQWVAVENKWLATRYGLEAIYIRTPGGKRRPLAYDLSEVLERLVPVAKESGDVGFLASLKPVDKLVNGAARQRELYRAKGDWKSLIDAMVKQLQRDLADTDAE